MISHEFKEEQWKIVQFDFEYTNKTVIEISSHGRLRSTNAISNKKILKTSFINGYPSVQLKFFKPHDEKTEKRLAYLKEQVSKLSKQIIFLKEKANACKAKDEVYYGYRKQIAEADELMAALKNDYGKKAKAALLARTINIGCLLHRLTAKYFVKQPTPQHNLVGHIDHNKINNHFTNLKWMTQEESTAHQSKSPKVIAEKKTRGGRRPSAKNYKLTETRVMLIKKKINGGSRLSTLAKQFQITETQLLRIKRGQNWGDVKAAR